MLREWLYELTWFLAAAGAAAWVTGLVRRHALATGVIDIPNARSSHTRPTPRGGGLAIVLSAVTGAVALACIGILEPAVAAVLAVGGVAIAGIGYVDDKRGLKPLPRLLVHVAAAALAAGVLGAGASSNVLPQLLPQAVLVVMAIGIVWSTNLFNFMDGIDGIAASQAVFVSGASAALIIAADGPVGFSVLLALTAGACTGFLLWNWPPARIFMGDVGSGFLGFWLASIATALHLSGVLSIWVSLILGVVFIADATVTLLRRMICGDSWLQAHRSHAYQHLTRRFGSHRTVSLGVWVLNLAVALPLATLAQRLPQLGPYIAATLFAGSGAVCLLCGAGRQERAAVSA